MKRLPLIFALIFALLLSTAASAQSYRFVSIANPHDSNDPFTQLLGINNNMVIAGYHNFFNNQGFTLNLPMQFTTENYPNSMMTQVIGINNSLTTDGFYVDNNSVTHGFYRTSNGTYTTVDFAGTAFNQLLGQNDMQQASGYYSLSQNNSTPDFPYIYDEAAGVFEVITIPGAVGGAQATGVNNSREVCGFFIDQNQVNHGFLLNFGVLVQLDFPGSTFTQALGLNNHGQVVGTYMDAAGLTHGFLYTVSSGQYTQIDDPNGIGQTVVNGINDNGALVGFYGAAPINTGFVAVPQ
jgi:probable HAF family extracellular repeat protein